jgi:ribose 5-phosphate isomerase B
MRIAFGCDHVGFPLKATVMAALEDDDHAVLDLGTHGTDPVDYPALAKAVATAVANGFVEGGILLCGSSAGGAIAANKFKNIRAAACADAAGARHAREHVDVNVLCLDAAHLDVEDMVAITREWASTEFARADSAVRVLTRIAEIEEGLRTPERGAETKAKAPRAAAPRRAASTAAAPARTAASTPSRESRPEADARKAAPVPVAVVAAPDLTGAESFLAGVKDDNLKAMTARIIEFMRGRFPRASGTQNPDGFSFHVGGEHAASVTVGKGFVQLEAGPDRIPTSRIRDVEGLEVALALPSIVRAMGTIRP